MHDRRKHRENGLTVTDALCKALGWYFPLVSKMRIRSVKDLIFRKYPYACPYCGLAPHRDRQCKLVRGSGSIDQSDLRRLHVQNAHRRPQTLNAWQQMFQDIYPREVDDKGRSTIGLFEELGELAEAIRVFDKHPMYFLGEAADVFSYLMGIANEHSIRLEQDDGEHFSLEEEFEKKYPGLCMQCGSRICVCPAIPEATIGRMAKELKIITGEDLFFIEPDGFTEQGQSIAERVLDRVGGYEGLTSGELPLDRGEANRALVLLCLKVAEAVEGEQPAFAARLKAEALKLGTAQAIPGTAARQVDIEALLAELTSIWRNLDPTEKAKIKSSNKMVGEFGGFLEKMRILLVLCSPADAARIRVDIEHRSVLEAINVVDLEGRLLVTPLPAARIDDLRRALLKNDYEIIHFAGHADRDCLVFEGEDGTSDPAPLSALAELIGRRRSVKCVLLNACEAAQLLSKPISTITVGMETVINDSLAIAFAKGFYEALATGHSIEFAIDDGISAVKIAGLDAGPIKVLKATEDAGVMR
jgi:NTP pyrophosphatase (non-canonical NTP hydrolase)